jgi:hypothetical protein
LARRRPVLRSVVARQSAEGRWPSAEAKLSAPIALDDAVLPVIGGVGRVEELLLTDQHAAAVVALGAGVLALTAVGEGQALVHGGASWRCDRWATAAGECPGAAALTGRGGIGVRGRRQASS